MEILKDFGIQPTLLLAQIVNFLIILFVLKKFFYKPIIKVLEDRKKRIDQSLQNADLIEENLKKTQDQSAQIIAQAQKNAQELIQEAKAETQRLSAQAATDAKKQVEEILASARVQIEAQKESMQKHLEKETLTLVIGVVKKVLGRNLKEQEKAQITKSAVSELTKQVS